MLKKTDNNLYCLRFRRVPDNVWVDMADYDSLRFIEQFYPGYKDDPEVKLCGEIQAVVNKTEEMKLFAERNPVFAGYSRSQLISVIQQKTHKLFCKAFKNLGNEISAKRLETQRIRVREVSAYMTETSVPPVWMQVADSKIRNFGNAFYVPAFQVQNVRSRIMDEGKPTEHMQILYRHDGNHQEGHWYNVMKSDFEP